MARLRAAGGRRGMYLRHAVRRKGRKAHTYWRLVRSVRRGRRVVQETVAHLGELDAQGRAKARALAQQITGRGAQHELFEAEGTPGEAIAVRLDQIRLERSRAFGAGWLGGGPWRALGVGNLCAGLPPPGRAAGNPLAQRGYSRDHRPDCKQVNIALVVTRGGVPLGYEVFAGNRTDVTTVQEIVETMEERYGTGERIWVMDRGMTSRKNLAWLQATGRRYLIGTPRTELAKWRTALAAPQDWQQLREGIEVKRCTGTAGTETLLLCRSAERREKERAMHERFATRIDAGLARLGRRLERARKALDRSPLERQIGRLLGRNPRAAGRYRIALLDDSNAAAGLTLRWDVQEHWDERTRQSEGCYILRTNVQDWTPETMWKTYVQLWEVEAAFRIHKSELAIRPIWHQKPERVQAHILVCFLAYVLWKTLEHWQGHAGLGQRPRTILHELARIQSTDVVLPLAAEPARALRLRCVIRPDKTQAVLLDLLRLRLPERLPLPASLARTESRP